MKKERVSEKITNGEEGRVLTPDSKRSGHSPPIVPVAACTNCERDRGHANRSVVCPEKAQTTQAG
ncbi:hypothetical protein ACSEYT_10170 [Vibrio cidicii]|uniref:hypothetical protein n=1 Tax=Vibrio cidicii TaxID=1763883 RepID=UPI00111282F7|nr:hypothetical protein [Vibrio cidicii]